MRGTSLLLCALLPFLASCGSQTEGPPLRDAGTASRGEAVSCPTPTPTGRLSVPYWQSSFSYSGKTYPYAMVGSNPICGGSTTVGVQIVPVALTYSNGALMDPTLLAQQLHASPLFTSNAYQIGNTQYGDAFMRSQFAYIAEKSYRVLLAAPVLEPTQYVVVPSADGYVTTLNGHQTGVVTFSWFMQLEQQIIVQLKIDPRTLTLFPTFNTSMLESGGGCCYGGYHSVFAMNTAYGPALATGAWASIGKSNVKPLSHEVAEWLADPFYNNVVPSWKSPISGFCNGDLLEVGDPVANLNPEVNGWGVSDAAFFSWFTRQPPSIGIGGKYDLDGYLTGPSASC